MPDLGPDATGWAGSTSTSSLGAQRTLAELRTIQDWHVRYQLAKAEGVAEVASVGGFVKQYQVVVLDPREAAAPTACPLGKQMRDADRGQQRRRGRTRRRDDRDRVHRPRPRLLRGVADLEQVVLKAEGGAPVLLRDVARVELGPDERAASPSLTAKARS
jgi:Cu(I)/Ag(I) efflux system membrane protein CusA/SilA